MRLIDADELIKDIDSSADMGGALGKVVECVKYYAKFMVASTPTIEERKIGQWICSDDLYEEGGCSVCKWDSGESYVNCKEWFNYCPNCGARMSE